MRKDLENLGIDVAQNGNSFSFVDSDTLKNVTVQLADKKTEQSARVVQNSNGIISNRDFVSEIKKALTADGQIDTDISDQELGVVAQLAGMLGNDVTDKIEFVSAYSDSLTDKENKALAGARGATSFDRVMQSARIILSDQSDASTVVHEMFHVALEYNETARKNLTDAVRQQMKTSERRKELESFLSEHMEELSGFESVEDAMNSLEKVAKYPSKLSVKSKEVLTKMFEMFNSADSKAKENMPTGVKKVFKELADIFRKIYRNITGKTLMPDRIADAYAGFLTNVSAEEKEILRQSAMKKETAEEILKSIDDKKPFNTYSGEERLAFATKYADDTLYDPDKENENVKIHNKRKRDSQLEEELKSARKLASFGFKVYLLPSDIPSEISGLIIDGRKNPDALVNMAFVDFKSPVDSNEKAIQNEIRKGKKQADVIFINLNKSITEEEARGEVIRQYMGTKNKASYENKNVIFSSADGNYYCYEIKMGRYLRTCP